MTRDGVNPDEKCDGDHCFHRLMLISNSIYFCFPMDHTTNQCLSVHRKKARDWNYTLHNVSMFVETRLYRKIKKIMKGNLGVTGKLLAFFCAMHLSSISSITPSHILHQYPTLGYCQHPFQQAEFQQVSTIVAAPTFSDRSSDCLACDT